MDWGLWEQPAPNAHSWSAQDIQIILLQEIRDELKTLNSLLGCANFTGIPQTLKRIERAVKGKPAKRGRPRKDAGGPR